MEIGIIFVRDLELTSAKDPEDPQSLDKICNHSVTRQEE